MLHTENNISEKTYLEILALIVEIIKISLYSKKISSNSSKKQKIETLKKICSKYSSKDILYVISRHKLVSFFYKNITFREIFSNQIHLLRNLYKIETIKTIKYSFLISFINNLFRSNQIKVLFIKGIPLSLLTTGIKNGRDIKDLDIWIDKKDISKVLKLLNSNGFIDLKNNFPYKLKNLFGEYSRLVNNSITLFKEDKNNFLIIDIHWGIANTINSLPNFKEAWDSRTQIYINKDSINTLSINHAYLFACFSYSKDRWIYLRDLIDINLLKDKLGDNKLRKSNFIKMSLFMNDYLFKNYYEKNLLNSYTKSTLKFSLFKTKKITKIEQWTINNRISLFFNGFVIRDSYIDYILHFLWEVFPPNLVKKPADLSFFQFSGLIFKRCLRLYKLIIKELFKI